MALAQPRPGPAASLAPFPSKFIFFKIPHSSETRGLCPRLARPPTRLQTAGCPPSRGLRGVWGRLRPHHASASGRGDSGVDVRAAE